MLEGYHILVGGRTGIDFAIGTKLFDSVAFDDVPAAIELILDHYIHNRNRQESFADFTHRVDLHSILMFTPQCGGATVVEPSTVELETTRQ